MEAAAGMLEEAIGVEEAIEFLMFILCPTFKITKIETAITITITIIAALKYFFIFICNKNLPAGF